MAACSNETLKRCETFCLKSRILIACTGSVAAIKLPSLCSSVGSSYDVKVVVTERSLHFFNIDELPSDVLVYRDADEWKWGDRTDPVLHIELRKWADLMVIAPLDANTLAKIANGICDNLLTCIVRAWDFSKPLLFCPAMNTFMWNNPITSRHIQSLKQMGFVEVPCVEKRLACGDKGLGAMAEVSIIVDAVHSFVQSAVRLASCTIQDKLVVAPITALSVINNYILAGEGRQVHIYDLNTSQPIHCFPVFSEAVVHGIRQGSKLVCVFGQLYFRLLERPTQTRNSWILYGGENLLEDWIWDAKFLAEQGTEKTMAAVLAHNFVLEWDIKEKKVLRTVSCEENCLLYSAKLIGSCWNDLVVASGTVYNEVLLWNTWPPGGGNEKQPVLTRLTGHKGVVFCIDYSEVVRRLCSVSDDRSIRVYKVGEADSLANAEFSLESVLFGHGARVWSAKLLTRHLVSVSEDGTCCVWSYDQQVIRRFDRQAGKCIWSLAVDASETFIVTGGTDCSIRTWIIDDSSVSCKSRVLNLPVLHGSVDTAVESSTLTPSLDEAVPATIATPSSNSEFAYTRVLTTATTNALRAVETSGITPLSDEAVPATITTPSSNSEFVYTQVLTTATTNASRAVETSGITPLSDEVVPATTATPSGVICDYIQDVTSAPRAVVTSGITPSSAGAMHATTGIPGCSLISDDTQNDTITATSAARAIVTSGVTPSSDEAVLASCFTPACSFSCDNQDAASAITGRLSNAAVPFSNTDVSCSAISNDATAQHAVSASTADVGNGCRDAISKSTDIPSDFPRSVSLTKSGALVVTNNGLLCMYDRASDDCAVLLNDARYRSYAVMIADDEYTAVGNLHGDVSAFYMGCSGEEIQRREVHAYDGKVFNLTWGSCGTFLSSGPDGRIIVWKLCLLRCQFELLRIKSLLLPVSKHRWITAALLGGDHDNRIVAGDRGGSIHVYTSAKSNCEMAEEPAQSHFRVHGKTGVTGISYHRGFLYSIGRDGCCKLWSLTSGGLQLIRSARVHSDMTWLERIHFVKDDTLVIGFLSSSLVVWSTAQNVCLLSIPCGGGHRSWDLRFDTSSSVPRNCSYVYIKSSSTHVGKAELCFPLVLKDAFHSSQINAVKHLFACRTTDGSSVSVLATASEDTDVNLFSIEDKGDACSLKVLHRLTNHISSVRTLAVGDQSSSGLPVILFTAGGRAQMMAWKLFSTHQESSRSTYVRSEVERRTVAPSDGALPCDHEHDCDRSESQRNDCNNDGGFANTSNPDLSSRDLLAHLQYQLLASTSISRRSQQRKKLWKSRHLVASPDTRFMSLTAVRICSRSNGDASADDDDDDDGIGEAGSSGFYLIAAGCSDGKIRLFGFGQHERSFTTVDSTDFHGRCVTQVEHLYVHGYLLLVSASTGGQIALWNITWHKDFLSDRCPEDNAVQMGESCSSHMNSPLYVLGAHQSGINSLDVAVNNGEVTIVSGGDDNAVKFAKLQISEELTVTLVDKAKTLDAHAAQITGVKLISTDLLLTASIDQRVTLWQVHRKNGEMMIQQLSCKCTQVADISSIDVWTSRDAVRVFIVGTGVEVLELRRDQANS